MRELINDPFYQLIEKYDRCIIDYCLIEDDTPHQGYRSHKDAVLFAMLKVIERYIDEQLMSEISYCRKVQDERRYCGPTVSAKGSMTADCRIL